MINFAAHVFNTGLSVFGFFFGLVTGIQWITIFWSAMFVFSLFMSFVSYKIITEGKK